MFILELVLLLGFQSELVISLGRAITGALPFHRVSMSHLGHVSSMAGTQTEGQGLDHVRIALVHLDQNVEEVAHLKWKGVTRGSGGFR